MASGVLVEVSGTAKAPGSGWWRLHLLLPGVALLLVELLLLPLRIWMAWPIQASFNEVLVVLFSYLGAQAVVREIRDPSARRLSIWVGVATAGRLLQHKALSHPQVLLLLSVRIGVCHGGLAGALIGAILLFQALGDSPSFASWVSWARVIYLAAGSAAGFAGVGVLVGGIAGAVLLPIALRLLR